MVDRVALIRVLEPLIDPTPTQREMIRKSLDKALQDFLPSLPLEAAHRLPPPAKSELSVVMRELCSSKELEKIAANWEPRRKLDAFLKQTLLSDLVDLLQQRRLSYDGLDAIALETALQTPDKYRALIKVAPKAHVAKLLKSWDKHFKATTSSRDELVQRLFALMAGARPIERKPSPPKRAA